MNESTSRGSSLRRSFRPQAGRPVPAPGATSPPIWPVSRAGGTGPLGDTDTACIHDAALSLLSEVGLSQAIPSMVERVSARGGRHTADGRLTFPRPSSRT